MSAATQICAARIIRYHEEGMRADVYDDATGKPIECEGQPTIGYGCRCRQWSEGLARAVLSLELEERESPLMQFSWYLACNDPRRSALLEIDYNQGEFGLVRGYPRLISAVALGDWAQSMAQCSVRDPRLKDRYDRIGHVLFTGLDAP